MRILLIKDDQDRLNTLIPVLESHGLAITVCADGAEALATVRCQTSDAVLLHMTTPEANRPGLVGQLLGVEEFRCGMLRMDLDGRIFRGTVQIDAVGREFTLLKNLMMGGGRAIPKDELHRSVFGDDGEFSSDAFDLVVHRLRKRLQGDGITLITLRGVGYLLVDESQSRR